MTTMRRICVRRIMAEGGARILIVAACLCAGCTSMMPDRRFDAGFLASRDSTLQGEDRLRAAGPLFEHQQADEELRFTALRPFYAGLDDPRRQWRVRDVLWPVATVRMIENELSWRVLLAYGCDFSSEPGSRYRAALFPIVFVGRDADGEEYFAFFPLGGKINGFLGYDTFRFALFPLYARAAINDVETVWYLWPLFSQTRGSGIFRLRIFPFYGVSETEGQWVKRYVLWPIWTSVRYTYPDEEGGGFLLFPLYGYASVGDKTSWTALPPLFRWASGPTQWDLHCPWPVFQMAGGDVEKLYIWPLWGRRQRGSVRTSFFLWPLGGCVAIDRPNRESRRFVFVPFVYHERTRRLTEEDVTLGSSFYFKLWPLFSYQREDDVSRFRTLALWPLKHTAPIERNLAPLWSLYTRERTADAGMQELLWGLFHQRYGDEGSEGRLFPLFSWRRDGPGGTGPEDGGFGWSFLYGLAGYEREGEQRSLRLFYFLRFGDAGR